MSSPPAPNCSDPAAIINRIYQLYEMIQNIMQILGQLKSLCGKSFSEIAVNVFQLSMALGTFAVHTFFFFTPSLNPLGDSAGRDEVKAKTVVAKPSIMVEEVKDEKNGQADSETATETDIKDVTEKKSTGKTTLVTVTEEGSSNAQELPIMAGADRTTIN